MMERSNFSTKKRLLPTESSCSVRESRSPSENAGGTAKGSSATGCEASWKTCCGMSV